MLEESRSYPESIVIQPLSRPPRATVRVPGSKSITNRALVLAALCGKVQACELLNCLHSEDTEIMAQSLRALGFDVDAHWKEGRIRVAGGASKNRIPATQADLFVGNSGTTMRFLTALVALGHGTYRLDGVP